jgi:RNA recognition motif-containing protein
MVKTIFVSNLSPEVDEEQIRELFIRYGEVHSVNLLTHRKTGKSRGICFIEMNQDDADAAIQALDGKDLEGRELYVRFMEEEDAKNTVELNIVSIKKTKQKS